MINFSYLRAELFRRRTKTFLIAAGLAVPIALTILVGAFSTGLGSAQDEVLEPLVGLGTDMTATKSTTPEGGGPPGGPARVGFADREPGEEFSENTFTTGFNTAFSDKNVDKVENLGDVTEAAGALTVNNIVVSGTIPEQTGTSGGGPGMGGNQMGGGGGGPDSISFDNKSVTGLPTGTDLGPVSADQLQTGKWLADDNSKQAVISSSYAKSNDLAVGDEVKVKSTSFEIVGIVSSPLAGSASDVYVKLGQLQSIADMENKITTVYVRATSQEAVAAVSDEVKSTLGGSTTVTTNSSLANQVSGSLVSANRLVDKISAFLLIALLAAAAIITSILTLNAVNKRTREFGTLKSIGWSDGRLIRQVMGESLATGMIGAAAGAVLGVIGIAVAKQVPMSLEVSGASGGGGGAVRALAGGGAPPGGAAPGGGGGGPFGAAREAATQTIEIIPTLSVSTILIAAAIGAVTALIAGAAGSFKTSKLSPVEALKHVD